MVFSFFKKEQKLFNHLRDINYQNTKRRRDGNAGKKDKEKNRQKEEKIRRNRDNFFLL